MKYSIVIPTIRLEMAKDAAESLIPAETTIVHSTEKAESFSRLVNQCIENTPTEIVIICNDKIRAKELHIRQIMEYINKGYGIVAMDRFNMFGFRKQVFRKIGLFDERFIGGGFEDWDMIRRLKEADIAYWEMAGRVECKNLPSTWEYGKSLYECDAIKHLYRKWDMDRDGHKVLVRYLLESNRVLEEDQYNYDMGAAVPCKFLPWKVTKLASWR